MGIYIVDIMGYKTTPGLLHNLQILVVSYGGGSNAFCEQYTKSKKKKFILKELTGVYTSGEHVVYFNITCKTLLAWRVKAGGLELKYDIVLCIMKC
jgi:hypothetical protein